MGPQATRCLTARCSRGSAPGTVSRPARVLLVVGIALILVGMLGLAFTAGNPTASRALVRYVFIPSYALGTLALIAGGVLWLRQFMKR